MRELFRWDPFLEMVPSLGALESVAFSSSDKIHAELKSGVLTLSVPKKPEAQPKKIEVQSK